MNSVKYKLAAIGVIPVILFVLLMLIYVLPVFRSGIYEEKELMTREMIDIAWSTVNSYYELSQQELLTEKEAQAEAIKVIESMRYGYNMLNDFFMFDYDYTVIATPVKELKGIDGRVVQDPDGVRLIEELVNAGKRGGDYVTYRWGYYNDETRIEPKLSYAAPFKPWEWVIGTGIFINDIEDSISAARNSLLLWTLIIIAVTTVAVVFVANPIIRNVNDSTGFVTNYLAKGDFSKDVPEYAVKLKDEFGGLARGFETMVKSLREIFGTIGDSQHKVSSSSESLAASSQEMSASLEEVAASANEFSGNAHALSSSAQQMSELGSRTSQQALEGNAAVEKAVSEMHEISAIVNSLKDVVGALGSRALDISKIVITIKSIADQTNLLALNAAIEAARAGEQGRGFAVVADEVRKLAEQSSGSASEITDMVGDIDKQIQEVMQRMDTSVIRVEKGTEVVLDAGAVLKSITASLDDIAHQIEQVSAAAQEIGAGSQEVSAAVEEQTATMNEISGAATDLQGLVNGLESALGRFKY